MRPLIEDRYGVKIVALSRDTQAQVQRQQKRDSLSFTLLSDPKLAVIRQFGLVHHKGLPFKTFHLFGIPLGVPRKPQSMAIPTTLIVDQDGIVRWIDQADDYRMRGDEARIRAALADVFGEPGASQPDAADLA